MNACDVYCRQSFISKYLEIVNFSSQFVSVLKADYFSAILKHKNNRTLNIFSIRLIFISLRNTESCIVTSGFSTREKTAFWCSFGEIKIDPTLKRSNVLYGILPKMEQFCLAM